MKLTSTSGLRAARALLDQLAAEPGIRRNSFITLAMPIFSKLFKARARSRLEEFLSELSSSTAPNRRRPSNGDDTAAVRVKKIPAFVRRMFGEACGVGVDLIGPAGTDGFALARSLGGGIADGAHQRSRSRSRVVSIDTRAVPRVRDTPGQGARAHMVYAAQATRPQRYWT